MQAIKASNRTLWKQFFKDAILDLDPTSAEQKLEAAKKAIEDRLREIHARGGIDHRERMELEDAQRTILFLGKHEQQTLKCRRRCGVGWVVDIRSKPTPSTPHLQSLNLT